MCFKTRRNYIQFLILLLFCIEGCHKKPPPVQTDTDSSTQSTQSNVGYVLPPHPETPEEKNIAISRRVKLFIEAVYGRKVKDDQEVTPLVNMYAQAGAVSVFEYLVNTEEYRALEKQNRATINQIRFFSCEMAMLDAAPNESAEEIEIRRGKIAEASLNYSSFSLKRMLQQRLIVEAAKLPPRYSGATRSWAIKIIYGWEDWEPYPAGVPSNLLKDQAFYRAWFELMGVKGVVADVLLRMHSSLNHTGSI